MKTVNEQGIISLRGHVVIRDVTSGEIILDKHNDINNANMIASIVGSLSGDTTPRKITHLAFGNAGSSITNSGAINYKAPNTDNANGTLYNETLRRELSPSDEDNKISTAPDINDSNTQDILIEVTLGYGDSDLSGQSVLDNSTNFTGDFIFDEIGIVNEQGEFLTHIVFHPIEKSTNRKLVIEYTVRIKVGS